MVIEDLLIKVIHREGLEGCTTNFYLLEETEALMLLNHLASQLGMVAVPRRLVEGETKANPT